MVPHVYGISSLLLLIQRWDFFFFNKFKFIPNLIQDMNSLRCLAFKAKPLNEASKKLFNEKPSISRMGILKRNMMGETYEGTGKTTGYILNKKGIDVICIDYISAKGFTLTNGWTVVGPTIFFPHTLLCWKINNVLDIDEESLALFSILQPKLDCLFIGYGYREELTYVRLKELLALFNKMKINVELLPTNDAATTFNFCALDRRFVAAALLPPRKLTFHHNLELIAD